MSLNSKVRIGTVTATELSEARAEAGREKLRADMAERKLRRIKRRIYAFYEAIDFVAFPADPPVWAETWREWLVNGVLPNGAPVLERERAQARYKPPVPTQTLDEVIEEMQDDPDPSAA